MTMLKPLTVWITTNCGKFLKEKEIPDHLTCFLRNLYAGKKQQLELDMEQELPDVQAEFRKKNTEEPENKVLTFFGSWGKQGSSRKTSISASLTTLKPLTVWITTDSGKFLKRWENHATLPAS